MPTYNRKLPRLLQGWGDGPEVISCDVEPTIWQLASGSFFPRDGRCGNALANVPDLDAGHANLMLAYYWRGLVIGIMGCLFTHCRCQGLDPRMVSVWRCYVRVKWHCFNERESSGEQVGLLMWGAAVLVGCMLDTKVHGCREACPLLWSSVVRVPYEVLEAALANSARSIGSIVAMSPWRPPFYSQRVWSVYQLFIALSIDGVTFELLLPQCRAEPFCDAFKQEVLWSERKAVGKTRVSDACISKQSDQVRTLKFVERGSGLVALSARFAQPIQSWFMLQDSAADHGRAAHVAQICGQVAELDYDVGGCNETEKIHEDRAVFCRQPGAEVTVSSARLRCFLGLSFSKRGNCGCSLEHQPTACQLFETARCGKTVDAADCRDVIGAMLREQGLFTDAMDNCLVPLAMYDLLGAGNTKKAAVCITAIGRALGPALPWRSIPTLQTGSCHTTWYGCSILCHTCHSGLHQVYWTGLVQARRLGMRPRAPSPGFGCLQSCWRCLHRSRCRWPRLDRKGLARRRRKSSRTAAS